MPSPRYRSLASYFKQMYGEPVRKISLHAGFTCPNRDGSLSQAGCSYCAPESFSVHSSPKPVPLVQQIEQGIEAGHRRGVRRFMAYFQAYTTTYAPLEHLQTVYNTIRSFPEIAGLAIGTRPDCVDREKLQLINTYTQDYDVWLDYGLQSIHQETLLRINRGHGPEAFCRAMALTREFSDLKICVHVILGLPGENSDMEIETAKVIAGLKCEGIKVHPLHVVAGTRLAQEYVQGKYKPLTLDQYAERVVRVLEVLWPETVVHRLSADSLGETLVAPEWLKDKHAVLRAIQVKMEVEDAYQGKRYVRA